MSKMVEFEIVLSGDHPDIFVTFNAKSDISDDELLYRAIEEATNNTYIYSKKMKTIKRIIYTS